MMEYTVNSFTHDITLLWTMIGQTPLWKVIAWIILAPTMLLLVFGALMALDEELGFIIGLFSKKPKL